VIHTPRYYKDGDKLRVQKNATPLLIHHYEYLTQKGFFPYTFVDNFECYQQKELPAKHFFDSDLNLSKMSQKDYNFVRKLYYGVFKCSIFQDYAELYCKTDVLLLADVFELHRAISHKSYGLDPAQFLTLPSLSWSAALKQKKDGVSLLLDKETYKLIQDSLRGGFSTSVHRQVGGNNPYMKNFDPSKPVTYCVYIDANNLYGWAMCQKLPSSNFRWEDEDTVKEYNADKILCMPDLGDEGCIFEVTMSYQNKKVMHHGKEYELHDLHNDFPCAPEPKSSKSCLSD
jgi:hypothetical protein